MSAVTVDSRLRSSLKLDHSHRARLRQPCEKWRSWCEVTLPTSQLVRADASMIVNVKVPIHMLANAAVPSMSDAGHQQLVAAEQVLQGLRLGASPALLRNLHDPSRDVPTSRPSPAKSWTFRQRSRMVGGDPEDRVRTNP